MFLFCLTCTDGKTNYVLNESMGNIEHSKILELLDDEMFIEWLLFPTKELDTYWMQQLENKTDIQNKIESLKSIAKNLQLDKKQLSTDSKLRILKNIESTRSNITLKKRKYIFRRIVASIAVVLLIIGGKWYIESNRNLSVEVDYNLILADNTINEQSENIQLILDHKNRVSIDSSNVDIVYNQAGEININSEKVTKSTETQLNQLIVPYGKTSQIKLSDGSCIWVNSGSRLIYPSVFKENKREIYVEGEVYIEVAKMEQPFIIKTEKIEVEVLGTCFNLSTYRNEKEQSLVLVSGKVLVKDNLSKNTCNIQPNQRYTYNSELGTVSIQHVSVDEFVSWRYGFLTLRSEKIDAILNKLERYYNVVFSYDKNETKDIWVSGKLNLKDDIEDILKALSITTPMKYKINDKMIKLKFIKTLN